MEKDYSTLTNLWKQSGLTANFYMSPAYLARAKAVVVDRDWWMWAEADGWCIAPPVPYDLRADPNPPVDSVWSDCRVNPAWLSEKDGWTREFLDWEYLYDPQAFLDMKGKKWATFRKNCRKWPRRNPEYIYCTLPQVDYQTFDLLAEWMLKRQNTVNDPDIIVNYLAEPAPPGSGVSRWGLYEKGRLVGVNIWDYSRNHVNYRFCLHRDGEPFVDEFMRVLFYAQQAREFPSFVVNDGGTLGQAGLEAFKDKLNPITKRMVFTWKRKR